MAARPSWADLPDDLIAEIARRVTCPVDRVRAAWACRSWIEGVQTGRCPLQLPWLLRPYRIDAYLSPGTTRTASFFCVLCNRVHRVAVPDMTRGARFFGTYPGGWLFLAYSDYSQSYCWHGLINLRTDESRFLPDNIIGEWQGLAWKRPMLIHAATLSASPSKLEGCVGAAIVSVLSTPCLSEKCIVFWRMGSSVASCAFRMDAQDVIYHNGAFHFLTVLGDLFVCTPEFQNEAPLEQLQVRAESRTMLGGWLHGGPRYLVECRGELLRASDGLASSDSSGGDDLVQGVPDGAGAGTGRRSCLLLDRAACAGWPDAIRGARLLQILRGGSFSRISGRRLLLG